MDGVYRWWGNETWGGGGGVKERVDGQGQVDNRRWRLLVTAAGLRHAARSSGEKWGVGTKALD